MERDCKWCFYYTWEEPLLCAVEPEMAKDSRNACECRHYDYDSSFSFKQGFNPYAMWGFGVKFNKLGWHVAVPLDTMEMDMDEE